MSLKHQRGFTLMEVMVAVSATAIVIAAASGFLLKFVSWYDELSAKIAINRHARETYNVLAFGAISQSTGNDGTKNLYGINGRHRLPTGSLRSNYALSYTSNNLTLTPDLMATMSVTCAGTGSPMPDCISNSGAQTVRGWIGADIQTDSSSRSVSGNTAEVTFTVMNPFEIQRAASPAVFAENYRAIFTLNLGENDP